MNLLLVRHAIATPRTPERPDSLRPLTEAGRERFRRCVRGLERLGVRLDLILHSPWQRAKETALELARLTESQPRPTALLASEVNLELFDLIHGHDSVAMVGHEPWLSDLAIECLCPGSSLHFDLKKGSVLWLRGEARPGHMELVALLPPKVLTKI
ncbi:MAG: histidine phosphatase family protein [Planctomycetes bacterium]|nr:histidine phosphatase family protein [Planctomycetota bacterium]